jgi:AcrR family transcriptional regulator
MDVRNEPDARTRTARPGRAALLDAAADLLATTTIEDAVGATVGVRGVAAAAGVTPSTVNHHFPGDGGTARNTRLCAAAIHHALLRRGVPVSERTADAALAAAEDLRAGDPDALARLARIAAEHLLGMAPDVEQQRDAESEAVATLIAAAVAPRSPEAVRSLRASYDQVTDTLAPMYEGLLETAGRRLTGGIDTVDLTCLIAALADGFRIRRRFEPERATADLFAEATIRLFESFSALKSDPQDPDPADRLLLLAPGSGLDPHKREAVVDAAWKVYDRDGFPGLTVAGVATEAGVSRATVVANFRDAGGLAAAVWARFMPRLSSEVEADLAAGRALPVVVRRHVDRLASVARAHGQLTTALFAAVFQQSVNQGPPRTKDPSDPRVLVPLPVLLVPPLLAHADEVRPPYAESATAAFDSAAMLTSQALQLCMTRPLLSPADVAHRVCDTTLAGMLRRRR